MFKVQNSVTVISYFWLYEVKYYMVSIGKIHISALLKALFT